MFIHSNGDVKKVAACKVKPYELKERNEENKEEKRDENRWNKMIEEDNKVENDDKEEEKETEKEENEDDKEVGMDDLNDGIGAKYLRMQKSVCFMENSIYVVEVPVKEHGKEEVIKAKENEIENLKKETILVINDDKKLLRMLERISYLENVGEIIKGSKQ